MKSWKAMTFDSLGSSKLKLPRLPNVHHAMNIHSLTNFRHSSASQSRPSTHPSLHIHPATRLTLSDTFVLLFRRLHTLGFANGILTCLAIFWAMVGLTIGALYGLSLYIKHREAHARRHRDSPYYDEDSGSTSIEIKITARRPSNLRLSPRSVLSSPERRASYGLVSPKSVRWAEQLENDQPLGSPLPPASPPPQYQAPSSAMLSHAATFNADDGDLGNYPPTTGRKRRHAALHKSERVRRVVAKLRAGGSNQRGFDETSEVVLAFEGDLA